MDDMRHLMAVRIPERELVRMFKAPEGTKVLGVHAEWIERSLYVMLEGSAFPPCPEGVHPPTMGAEFTRTSTTKGSSQDLACDLPQNTPSFL